MTLGVEGGEGQIFRLFECYPGTSTVDPSRCVKEYRKEAAGNSRELPMHLRPPATLSMTVDYLLSEACGAASRHG